MFSSSRSSVLHSSSVDGDSCCSGHVLLVSASPAEDPCRCVTLQVAPPWGPPLLAPGAAAPLPDVPPPLRGSTEAQQDCVFRHAFNLEVSREEGTPRGTVVVRLLGPFTAKWVPFLGLNLGPNSSWPPELLNYAACKPKHHAHLPAGCPQWTQAAARLLLYICALHCLQTRSAGDAVLAAGAGAGRQRRPGHPAVRGMPMVPLQLLLLRVPLWRFGMQCTVPPAPAPASTSAQYSLTTLENCCAGGGGGGGVAAAHLAPRQRGPPRRGRRLRHRGGLLAAHRPRC